ncbi:hypothetical protein FB45DRAFT_1034119 [Roridomyces roridus]|uniref:Glycoside hydrolase family 76 protein n=1 Tax=Roridomyces roridus TaxID=1738132 RepID=A0AAD7BDX8_9AGAR|nr:hypothetical protein FB45DRAFT_1034119 [Roridomyces roridus]
MTPVTFFLDFQGWPPYLFIILLLVQVHSARSGSTTISTSGWRVSTAFLHGTGLDDEPAFFVPSQKPNVTLSTAARVGTAAIALEKAIDNLPTTQQYDGQTYEFVATLFSEMADFDHITGQTKYEDTLDSLFGQTLGNRSLFSDPLTYGYAAIRAYAAYQNPIFLQYANESWTFGNEYTIPNPVTTPVVKNFPLSSVCQGATMAGGTFYTNSTGDPSVTAMSTGYFALLSALLAEATTGATSAPSYLSSAVQSAEFIQSHLYNADNLVIETISAAQNESCKITNSAVASFNQGLFIEGLATLQSISPSENTQTMLESLITTSLTESGFQTENGIQLCRIGSNDGDNILIRALSSAYTRNVTSPELRQVLHDYLSVQYNAVVDLATAGGTDIYSLQWSVQSSSTTTFSMSGQTNALGVLLSGISLDDNNAADTTTTTTTTPSSSTRPSTSVSSSHAHKLAAGTIVGIVAGVVLIILLPGLTILIIHWRRRSRSGAVRPLSMPTLPPPIDYIPRSVVREPVPYSSASIAASERDTYVPSAVAATSSSTSPVGAWRRDEKTPRMLEEGQGRDNDVEAPPPDYDFR